MDSRDDLARLVILGRCIRLIPLAGALCCGVPPLCVGQGLVDGALDDLWQQVEAAAHAEGVEEVARLSEAWQGSWRVGWEGRCDDLLRHGGLFAPSSSFRLRQTLLVEHRPAPWPVWTLRLELERETLRLRHHADEDRLEWGHDNQAAGIGMEGVGAGWRGGLHAHAGDGRRGGQGHLAWTASGLPLCAGLSWRMEQQENRLSARFEGEDLRLDQRQDRRDGVAWLAWDWAAGTGLEGRLQWTGWVAPPADTRPALLPEGEGNSQVLALHAAWGGWRGELFYEGRRQDLQFHGRQGETPFAKVTRKDAGMESCGIRAACGDRCAFHLSGHQWRGQASGHVEFWPWTEGLVDLLGLRRYYRFSTAGRLAQAGGRARLAVAGPWRVEGALRLLYIRPEARLSHWKPVYLVFGVDDFHQLDLAYRSALLATPGIELKGSWRHLQWAYQFFQWVPLKTWKAESLDPGDGGATGGSVAGAYGGGFHLLRLDYCW